MKSNQTLAQEYLETAQIIEARIRAIRRQRGPDLGGIREHRINLLTEMYEECRIVGHLLERRDNTAG